MRGIKHFLGSLAIAGMVLASSVEVGAASTDQSGGGSAGQCRVDVNRSATPGVFDIVRATTRSGKCVCIVKTGPANQGGSAESALIALLDRRSCADAPLAADGAYGGGLGTGMIVGGVILVGGGLGAALATGGSKSP